MQTPARMLAALVFAALVPAGSSLRAQDVPVRADTIRGAEFSDRTFAEAFGLPPATDDHARTARDKLRCMEVEGAILCNIDVEYGSRDDCATLGLVSHFIVWFDLHQGRRIDKRVYVAVECPGHTVTMSSMRRHPVIEFTLASRDDGSREETSRTIVFITTDPG